MSAAFPQDGAAREMKVRRQKERFLMFTRVLIKYLEQIDPSMHQRARRIIRDCAERNKRQEKGYESVTLAMEKPLKRVVGPWYWKQAGRYLSQFLDQKKTQAAVRSAGARSSTGRLGLMVHYAGGVVENKQVTAVTFEPGIQVIDDNAFFGCTELTGIVIPESVTSIGEDAFSFCKSLTVVVISDGVTEIGNGAFRDCLSLEQVGLPDSFMKIGAEAFYRCLELKRIDIPRRVIEIGKDAFAYSGIENIVLPLGITTIPSCAFSNCRALLTIDLPASVKDIGFCAFDRCDSLENMVVSNGLPSLRKLNLDAYEFGVNWVHYLSQLLANAPNLEELSLREVKTSRQPGSRFEMLQDDDILIVLQLVSPYPSLRSLEFMSKSFTPNVFERLVSNNIPQNLRQLSIRGINQEQRLPASSLLTFLDIHPKLSIWTNKFWDDSEDENVRHHLEMNQYGCRGFTVIDPLWPILVERLSIANTIQRIETGVPNILYHLLRRHSEFLVGTSQRRHDFEKAKVHYSTSQFSYLLGEKNGDFVGQHNQEPRPAKRAHLE